MIELEQETVRLPPLQQDIISILREHGPATRAELIEELQMPRTTIYDGLRKLMKRKIVARFPGERTGKRGRPKVIFELITNNDKRSTKK